MAYKNIEDKRTYHRKYMRERREWLHAHGLCTECKKQDAYTLAGRWRCAECESKHIKGTAPDAIDAEIKREQKKADKAHILRWERREYGLCGRCGKPLDGQRLAWIDKPSRVCSACYQILALRMRPYGVQNHQGKGPVNDYWVLQQAKREKWLREMQTSCIESPLETVQEAMQEAVNACLRDAKGDSV